MMVWAMFTLLQNPIGVVDAIQSNTCLPQMSRVIRPESNQVIKGLRDRISPSCTLGQNGYGAIDV